MNGENCEMNPTPRRVKAQRTIHKLNGEWTPVRDLAKQAGLKKRQMAAFLRQAKANNIVENKVGPGGRGLWRKNA